MSITITPVAISKLSSSPKELSFGAVFSDHMFTRVYDELTGIQYGVREDRFGWVTTLEE